MQPCWQRRPGQAATRAQVQSVCLLGHGCTAATRGCERRRVATVAEIGNLDFRRVNANDTGSMMLACHALSPAAFIAASPGALLLEAWGPRGEHQGNTQLGRVLPMKATNHPDARLHIGTVETAAPRHRRVCKCAGGALLCLPAEDLPRCRLRRAAFRPPGMSRVPCLTSVVLDMAGECRTVGDAGSKSRGRPSDRTSLVRGPAGQPAFTQLQGASIHATAPGTCMHAPGAATYTRRP